jgi:hypothetical protein
VGLRKAYPKIWTSNWEHLENSECRDGFLWSSLIYIKTIRGIHLPSNLLAEISLTKKD